MVLVGFVLIIKGADFFIEGSKSIAAYFKMPPIVAGVVIVAFGTSLPELFVSINAVLKNAGDISVGNVIGSNIANIGLCLASAAIITPLMIKKSEAFKKTLALLAGSVLFTGFLWNGYLSRIEGLIMLMIFAVFLHLILSGQKQESLDKYSGIRTLLYFVGGIMALVLGSDMLVNNAIVIAQSVGVSERVIGLSLVALGTSLPELVTSVVAACKKDFAISVGNIVGSNIFNIFFILGTASSIKPAVIEPTLLTKDVPIMLLFVVFLLPFIFREKIGRLAGGIMLSGYLVYILSLFY
jgi:cation:H+ antiporter